MPYITQERRLELEVLLEAFLVQPEYVKLSAGDLNYLISNIINNELAKDKCYQKANDLVGMLEGVKLEFYRRKVAPYEDEKIKENGDI